MIKKMIKKKQKILTKKKKIVKKKNKINEKVSFRKKHFILVIKHQRKIFIGMVNE
jgi:hypothetical protein